MFVAMDNDIKMHPSIRIAPMFILLQEILLSLEHITICNARKSRAVSYSYDGRA